MSSTIPHVDKDKDKDEDKDRDRDLNQNVRASMKMQGSADSNKRLTGNLRSVRKEILT